MEDPFNQKKVTIDVNVPEPEGYGLAGMSQDHDEFLTTMGNQAFQRGNLVVNDGLVRMQDATRYLHLENLKYLRRVFRKTGHGDEECLPAFEFKQALQGIINEPRAVELIYMNVVRETGFVTWSDFTTFLLAVQKNLRWQEERYHFVNKMTKRASALTGESLTMIDCVAFASTHRTTGVLLTANKLGVITLWDVNLEEKLGQIVHRDKSYAYISNMVAGLSREHKAALARQGQALEAKERKTAITCMCVMPGTSHLVVGSGDCSVTVYDTISGDIIGRLIHMDDTPTSIDAFLVPVDPSEGNDQSDAKHDTSMLEGSSLMDARPSDDSNPHAHFHDIPTIVIGDNEGNVRILTLPPNFADTSDAGARNLNKALFSEAVGEKETSVRVMSRLHRSVVRDVRYFADLRLLATCSNDGDVNLIDLLKLEVRGVYVLLTLTLT